MPRNARHYWMNTGEGLLTADLKDCGCTCGELGVASYDLLEKDTRYFVISSPDSNPNPPSNPNSNINDIWIQAVAESIPKSNCSTNLDYDIGDDGVGVMDIHEVPLIISYLRSYTGVGEPKDDGEEGSIWVVYVEKFDDECEKLGDCSGFHTRNIPGLSFVETSSSAPALATAHEWGHAIGCDHVKIKGCVMNKYLPYTGNLVPKKNWDEVFR